MISVLTPAESLDNDIEISKNLSNDTLGPVEVIKWLHAALTKLRGQGETVSPLETTTESFGIEFDTTIDQARKQIAVVYTEQYLIPELKRSYTSAKEDLVALMDSCGQWLVELSDPELSQQRIGEIDTIIMQDETIRALVGGELLAGARGKVPSGEAKSSGSTLSRPRPGLAPVRRESLLEVCKAASVKIQEKMAVLDATMAQHGLDVTAQ